MLRNLSQRRGRGYERVVDESPDDGHVEAKLYRTKSLPVRMFGSVRKFNPIPEMKKSAEKEAKKIHPLFGIDPHSWKKTTSNPAFLRYLEYLKEGGQKF